MVNEAAVGVYAIAFKISSIFNVVLSRPTSLMLPAVLLPFAENNSVEKTKQMVGQIFTVLLYVGGAIYLSIPLVMKYFIPILVRSIGINREYLNAIGLIPIITLAPLLYFLEKPAGYSLLIVKKPEFVSISAVVAAVSNIGLNLLLIPILKAAGAALATSLSYLIYIILTYIWANIKYPNRYDYKNATITAILFSACFFVFWFIPFENDIVGLVVNLGMSITLILLVGGKILSLARNKSFTEVIKDLHLKLFSKSYIHDK
jgi:O-antigen/teichoic acid export membrane protein